MSSISQRQGPLEADLTWIEQLASKRAEIQERIREGKLKRGSAPVTMPIVQYGKGKDGLEVVHDQSFGVPNMNQNVENVNIRTTGAGYYGEHQGLTKKDFKQWQEAERLYGLVTSFVPPSHMPVISHLLSTMRAFIATKSTTAKTDGSLEILNVPTMGLPISGEQPQQQPPANYERRVGA